MRAYTASTDVQGKLMEMKTCAENEGAMSPEPKEERKKGDCVQNIEAPFLVVLINRSRNLVAHIKTKYQTGSR